MESIDATYPMELVHMDYLTVKANDSGKDVHILVITDHFMHFTRSQTAKCTAQNARDRFIVHIELPERF